MRVNRTAAHLRGLALVLAWASSSGCESGPEFVDYYTETAKICDWQGYRDEWFESRGMEAELPYHDIPAYPSEACVDRVLSDLHVDVDACLARDGLDSPYEKAVYGGGTLGGADSIIDGILAAARATLLFDLGDVDEISEGTFVAPAYVDAMRDVAEQTGVEALGGAQYNFIASLITEIRPAEEGAEDTDGDGLDAFATYHRSTGAVTIPEAFDITWDPSALIILLHEPRHAYEGTDHVECDDGSRGSSCDDTIDGPYGFSTGYPVYAYDAYEHPWLREYVRSRAWFAVRTVNDFTDHEGSVLPEIEDAFDLEFPEDSEE